MNTTMTHPKRLLVCLDASPRANFVLAISLELAKALDAKVVLFRAVGIPLDIPPEAFSHAPADLPAMLEAKAKADLEAFARGVATDRVEKRAVRIGVPWEAICMAAKEESADLVVIGSHGFSGLDRLLGTTAARVVNHADRSVLVVRNGAGVTR